MPPSAVVVVLLAFGIKVLPIDCQRFPEPKAVVCQLLAVANHGISQLLESVESPELLWSYCRVIFLGLGHSNSERGLLLQISSSRVVYFIFIALNWRINEFLKLLDL